MTALRQVLLLFFGLVWLLLLVLLGRTLTVEERPVFELRGGYEAVVVDHLEGAGGLCDVRLSYDHPIRSAPHRFRESTPCAVRPEVGEVVPVLAHPRHPYAVGTPAVTVGRPLSALLGLVGWSLVGLWGARRWKPRADWKPAVVEALKADGMSARVLDDDAIGFGDKGDRGLLEVSGGAMSVSMEAEGLVACHVSRATVLPGEALEVGLEGFDREWRLKTAEPRQLAMALSARARELCGRCDGFEVREGRMRVWGSTGHALRFVKTAIELRAALQAGIWADVELPGLSRTAGGFAGEPYGFPTKVVLNLDGAEVHTLVHVAAPSPIRAALDLPAPRPTGNVVLDQLIEVQGDHPLLQDDAFVELLLAFVHGEAGVVHKGHLAVEKPGLLVEELPELVDLMLRLARQLQPRD